MCIEFLDSNYSIAKYSKFFSLNTVNKSHISPLCAKHAKSDYNLYIHIIKVNSYKAVN